MDELDIKKFEFEGSPINDFFTSLYKEIVKDVYKNMWNDTFNKYPITTVKKEDIGQVIPIIQKE